MWALPALVIRPRLARSPLEYSEGTPGPVTQWNGRRHGRRQDRRWANSWSPEQIARRLPVDGDLTVEGDTIVEDLPFVADRAMAEALLRSMPGNSGGDNEGESVLEAVRAALDKPFRQGAVKVFVVLTAGTCRTAFPWRRREGSPESRGHHVRRLAAAPLLPAMGRGCPTQPGKHLRG